MKFTRRDQRRPTPTPAALAVPIQTALKDVGIDMQISKLSAAQFTENIGKKSMQAWIQTNLGSYVDDPYYQTFLWFGTDVRAQLVQVQQPEDRRRRRAVRRRCCPSAREARTGAGRCRTELNNDLPDDQLGEPNYLLPIRDDIEGFLYEPDGLLTLPHADAGGVRRPPRAMRAVPQGGAGALVAVRYRLAG